MLTIDIRDIKNEKVDLQKDSLKLSFTTENQNYEASVNFLEEINVAESKWNLLGLHMQFIIAKANKDASYWTRLTKENHKFSNILVDWEKYVDEDEEQNEGSKGLESWD